MVEKEFNLSEKIEVIMDIPTKLGVGMYREKHVKEFIKRLKDFLGYSKKSYADKDGYWVMRVDFIEDEINKLAGDKLI